MATAVLSRQQLKKELLQHCLRMQEQKVFHARQAMDRVQESANDQPSHSEDMVESFREACHIQRELFARQLAEAQRSLQVLQRLPPPSATLGPVPGLGSVVVTNRATYYIAISLGEVTLADQKYCVMSTASPLFQAMAPCGPGQSFQFRGHTYHVEEVF